MWFGFLESHGNSPQNKAKSFRLTAINDDEAFDHASIRKRFSLNSHQKHASLFRGVVALFVIVALILPPPQPPQQEERRKTAASQERWVVGLSDRLIPPAADLCGCHHQLLTPVLFFFLLSHSLGWGVSIDLAEISRTLTPAPIWLLTDCNSTEERKSTLAQDDRSSFRSISRHPEELAHPSGSNEESLGRPCVCGQYQAEATPQPRYIKCTTVVIDNFTL
ncbi:hypothetical protein BHE74_00034151 [Ensete ventricosum]|nr:hypothetical protein BHE74_00034151 [Ensete ventricosum]